MKYFKKIIRPSNWVRYASHVSGFWQRRQIVKKVQYRRRDPVTEYLPDPKVAAILQFFNKRANIAMLHSGLRTAGFDEVIVLEDGSSDGSLSDWAEMLQGKNDFIVRSNDIFEVRGYDRAIKSTSAKYIVLLQDDDRLPSSPEWLEEILEEFESDDSLAYVGGFHGLDLLPLGSNSTTSSSVQNGGGRYQELSGVYRRLLYNEDGEVNSLKYVAAVVRAPVVLRRSAYLDIGGMDLDFAPFICDDIDLCLRMWEGGYKVGLKNVEFIRDIGKGGMRTFNKDRFHDQTIKNWGLVYKKHHRLITSGRLMNLVDQAQRGASS